VSIRGEQDADSRNFSKSNVEDMATNLIDFADCDRQGRLENLGEGMGEGMGVRNGGHEAEGGQWAANQLGKGG
jgi:hypothetical protein